MANGVSQKGSTGSGNINRPQMPSLRIIKALETRGVSAYLIRMVESYFQNRMLAVGEERSEMVLGRGVPQGYVLDPLLWNLFYDGILSLRMPRERSVDGQRPQDGAACHKRVQDWIESGKVREQTCKYCGGIDSRQF